MPYLLAYLLTYLLTYLLQSRGLWMPYLLAYLLACLLTYLLMCKAGDSGCLIAHHARARQGTRGAAAQGVDSIQGTGHTSHLTAHTSHFTLHTAHLTPHISHLTLHTSHLTPHTSHLTPHTSHTSRFTLHTSQVSTLFRGPVSEICMQSGAGDAATKLGDRDHDLGGGEDGDHQPWAPSHD